MKLWEAMLKGAKQGPQLFNRQVDGSGGSCALGAISLGVGSLGHAFLEEQLEELALEAICPVGPCTRFTMGERTFSCAPHILSEVIVHLNNEHRWSRQRIAEWLVNRELKFAPSAAPKAAV